MKSTYKFNSNVNVRYDVRKSLLMLIVAFGLLLTTNSSNAHSGPLNTIALSVCENKEKSQACQYEDGHSNLFIGSCQYISKEDLICVRNKPIQKVEPEKTITEK